MAADRTDAPAETTPDWPTCRLYGSCQGVRVSGSDACVEHLSPDKLELFLRNLHPGADLDVRGTKLSESLLDKLLVAVRDSGGRPVLGDLQCEAAELTDAWFAGLRCTRTASFFKARFNGDAMFPGVSFDGAASFNEAWFGGDVNFEEAQFREFAAFVGAEFANARSLGPMLAGELDLRGARFSGSVDIDADTLRVTCDEARFEDGVSLTVRYGMITASRAVFGAPSSIASPFARLLEVWSHVPEWFAEVIGAEGRGERPVLLGLHDTDVSNLVLVNVDLSRCGFTGSHRLDQLRLEGRCEFGTPPAGLRWTKRQVLAEEAGWRGWPSGLRGPSRVGPDRLAGLYRSLRKSLEDSKYEAGAGDFYYGEMEMRRRSIETRRAERWILWFYWLLSGYGQRGGRALTALLVLIATVGVLLVFFGQPAGEAAKIAVGAVVLREAGTELTTAGEWTVMTARFLGPVLLALAVLAVRARVKR
jgi:hypothetical protein